MFAPVRQSDELPISGDSAFDRVREALVLGIIVLLIGAAAYAIIGFAWTFKAAVETSQRLRHPFSGRP